MYTHILIGAPTLEKQSIVTLEPWKQFRLVGETRTAQANTFVFESDVPLQIPVGVGRSGGVVLSLDILNNISEAWFLYGNCDGHPHSQSFCL
jgi:hypothetical protein